jgi:hypothetical protein
VRRISSRTTFWYKRLFPVFWFGVIAVIIIVMLSAKGGPPLLVILFPLAMAAFGYFLMKKLVFDLADEVWDAGDELIVRNRGREEHIRLSDIVNVSYSGFTSPARVTLTLREGGRPGREVSFCPPARLFKFLKNPVVSDLIERIDKSRTGR